MNHGEKLTRGSMKYIVIGTTSMADGLAVKLKESKPPNRRCSL
jgi:hypothetical protein